MTRNRAVLYEKDTPGWTTVAKLAGLDDYQVVYPGPGQEPSDDQDRIGGVAGPIDPIPPTWRVRGPRRSPKVDRGGARNRSTVQGPILVVEDDPEILSTVADILDFEGYRVERAVNGAEALEIIDRVRPSVILLDMRMPVLDGWEFARIARERGFSIPILVMTAAHSAERWAQEIGAEGYVAKPFDIADLLEAIERLRSEE